MTNNKKDTLVILTPGFPESEADTTCLPMQQHFVRALKENYPSLSIIILAFQYPYHNNTYKWYGTTIISFDGRNKGGIARLLLRRKLISTLNKINSKNKITGILSFWYGECAAVGKIFADKKNTKHYCWILGQDARKENKYPGRIHAGAGELIALSDFLQDEFERNHDTRPLHVIPAAIDTTSDSCNLQQDRDIDILAAGSLIPLKQFEILIGIVAEIKKKFPGVKAILIGDGPEKEKLRTLIAGAGLQDNITLTGEQPHPRVLQMMQRTKIFLHPSSYEGFSGVCQEALAAGAQVISFCRAMKLEIEQWHIVESCEDMTTTALEILEQTDLKFKPVTPFEMDDTVKKMMALLL